MTKTEIQAKINELSEGYAEQTRIFNEKMAVLEAEKEKYPEDRLATAQVEEALVLVETKNNLEEVK